MKVQIFPLCVRLCLCMCVKKGVMLYPGKSSSKGLPLNYCSTAIIGLYNIWGAIDFCVLKSHSVILWEALYRFGPKLIKKWRKLRINLHLTKQW